MTNPIAVTRRLDALVEQAKTARAEYAAVLTLRNEGNDADVVENQLQRVVEALSQVGYTLDAVKTSI